MLPILGPVSRAFGNLTGRLRCSFNRHRPERKTVRWNGVQYRAECRHCGQGIQRQPLGGWRVQAESDPRLTAVPPPAAD
ncbi:MAG: hypothetical protein RIS94_701 [Pseudomonadota bacterium]|jgi:hypothetical protein